MPDFDGLYSNFITGRLEIGPRNFYRQCIVQKPLHYNFTSLLKELDGDSSICNLIVRNFFIPFPKCIVFHKHTFFQGQIAMFTNAGHFYWRKYTAFAFPVLNDCALDIKSCYFLEFHTRDKEHVGQSRSYNILVKDDVLTIRADDREVVYKRVDDGSAPLTGLWQITGRMQEGKLVPIHRSGTRKTIKILSGKHFQWAAIDPGTKAFMGTGGGTYEFANGKYTEHIEFFSRDSSRVGTSLSFDGKLEKGEWHHSGLSSRGDKIYEVWSRSADFLISRLAD